MARRRYGTFTPARREALRKAQLASAAKRRAMGRRARVKKYARRTAIGVGVVGAVAGAGYGYHKASGSELTVSGKFPKVYHHVSGRRIGKTGLRRTPGGLHATVGARGGKERHIIYSHRINAKRSYHLGVGGHDMGKQARGFVKPSPANPHRFGVLTKKHYAIGSVYRRSNVHGKKVRGAPHKVTEYKPTKADFKNMARHNTPRRHTEQYAREAMIIGHTTAHTYQNRKIEESEVIRRTNSYVKGMEAKGKKVSSAHRAAAAKFYRNQPRYTGGTVKPLKTKGSRRRAYKRFKRRNDMPYVNPRVLGSRAKIQAP